MKQSPGPNRIILEVTNRCNLDCSICLRQSWSAITGSMSAEVFTKLIMDLSEYSSTPDILFGGYGEPLSHPDILEMIRQAAAGGSRTALITNGTLLTPDLADALADAGLKKLWISADSSHQEARHRFGENPPGILDFLGENLKSVNGNLKKLDPGLALVLTRDNPPEILALIDQGRNLGISSFFITNLEAYSPAQTGQLPYSLEQLRRPGSWRNAITDLLGEIEKVYTNNPEVVLDGVLSNYQDRCPFAERGDLVLRWDGEISPCLPLLYDRTIHIGSWEQQQIAHSLGNIRDRSIREIWEISEYTRLRKRLLEKEFSPCISCRDCWLSEDNLQDCMGFAHPTCGGCLWAEGLINCP